MIPVFLRSLAGLIRDLIASGKAVHVTEADAAELELLAGLFEQHGPVTYPVLLEKVGDVARIPAGALDVGMVLKVDGTATTQPAIEKEREVTPADFALGWLCSARLESAEYFPGFGEPYAMRAAVCAELAVICTQIVASVAWPVGGGKSYGPYNGTKAGARAAWGFIVEQLSAQVAPVRMMSVERGMVGYHHPSNPMLEKYRRELEAMK